MPLVRIEMMKGKSSEYKKTLLDCVHAGLMESIGIEDWEEYYIMFLYFLIRLP